MEDQEGPLVADAAHDVLDIIDVLRQLLTCHCGGITPPGTYLND
jgi:hypothetical protein